MGKISVKPTGLISKPHIVIIFNYNCPYVLMAPPNVDVDNLKEQYFADLLITEYTLECFVKYLVNARGFARLDRDCDFEFVEMSIHSLD